MITTAALAASLAAAAACAQPHDREPAAGTGTGTAAPAGPGILGMLGIRPSERSTDYVSGKTQFQLHTLLTEQRHPATMGLGRTAAADPHAALTMLSQVDGDIRTKLDSLAGDTTAFEAAADAVAEAVANGRRIYIYGCGATGRLAEEMESVFWRPFWRRVAADKSAAAKLRGRLADDIENNLIGEMTGGDRALISSLEGFEDLQLIGRLQLEGHGIRKGDAVICVTEGGETSSVIGTILRAREQWAEAGAGPEDSRRSLYFVYNNPDERLRPFERSRKVLDDPGITKLNLTTGPQAVTGSTRMQAATIETYVVGTVLEAGVARVLARFLDAGDMRRLGFPPVFSIAAAFREFGPLLDATRRALPALAEMTSLEAAVYARGGFSTYFAAKGLVTVFIDGTERSPTFRLFPLDTVGEPKRKCWFQVRTPAPDGPAAWESFLGRPFRGLRSGSYREPFEKLVDDPYLRKAALDSLARAGNDQRDLYDFSFPAAGAAGRGPGRGDLGVAVLIAPEDRDVWKAGSPFRAFMDVAKAAGAGLAVLLVSDDAGSAEKAADNLRRAYGGTAVVPVAVDGTGDPFGLKLQVAAKMLLNAHSTAVMAHLGRVVGNTMTGVSPSNLKLIGRATYLIQSHVNDVLTGAAWTARGGRRSPLTYAEANAVLFDSIDRLKGKQEPGGQPAEVAFSIIRILESFRRGKALDPDEALAMVKSPGLAAYLASLGAE